MKVVVFFLASNCIFYHVRQTDPNIVEWSCSTCITLQLVRGFEKLGSVITCMLFGTKLSC